MSMQGVDCLCPLLRQLLAGAKRRMVHHEPPELQP
jgi:hypothetical protein